MSAEKYAKVRCGASVYGLSCSLEKGHSSTINHKAYSGDDLNGELIKEVELPRFQHFD